MSGSTRAGQPRARWRARAATTTIPHRLAPLGVRHQPQDAGTLYLLFSFTDADGGRGDGLLIRAELFQPGLQFVNPAVQPDSRRCTARHGVRRDHAGFVGFANWMIPLQIGADMAFRA